MIDVLQDLHFIRPLWLLAMVPFILSYLALRQLSNLSGAWEKLIEPRLLKHLVVNTNSTGWMRPVTQMLPFGVIGAIAMAGPTWELAESPAGPGESTLLIAVEASETMKGIDVGPSRIERAKFKIQDLLDAKQAQRTGLFTYAGSAHVVMPPTTDTEVIKPYLMALEPDLMPVPGDDYTTLVGAFESLGKSAVKGPTTLVVATDGFMPRSEIPLGKWASDNNVRVVVWAVGTDAGVPADGIPGWDRTTMNAFAKSANADLIDLSLGDSDIRQILRIVGRHRIDSADPDDATLWKDFGWYLIFPLLLWALLWFRRGWVVRVGAISMVFGLLGCGDATFADAWLTRNMQGRYAFEKGDWETASTRFEDPMWRGLAAYRNQDWEKAINAFSRVKTAAGYHNLGNAYAQSGRLISAIKAYEKALALDPTFEPARRNRDLFQHDLDTMVESTDKEEAAKPIEPSDEDSMKLREDQKRDARPQNPFDAVEERKAGAELEAISEDRDEAWMRRVTTDPKKFLRSKFSAQAGSK